MLFSSLARSFLVLGACSMSLWSEDFTFTPASGNSGDWNLANNWSPNGVPGDSKTVLIPAGKTAIISTPAYVSTMTIDGTLELAGDSLTTNDAITITIRSGGTLAVTGHASLLQSTVAVTDANPTNSIDPTTILVENGGQLSISADKTLTLQNGIVVDNQGTLALARRAAIEYDSSSLLSEFRNTGTITWAMIPNITAIRYPALVTIDGTLTATVASNYYPEVADLCTLLDVKSGSTFSNGDFTTATIPSSSFAAESTNATIAYRCSSSTLVDHVVDITTSGIPSSFTYGDTLTLAVTATDGVSTTHTGAAATWQTSDSSKVSLSGNVATMVGIGSSVVLTANVAAHDNFRAGSDTVTLGTISPKQVTVTVVGGSRSVGGTNPAPTFTTNGLVTGDLASILGTPVYSGTGTTADTTTVAGTYPLTVSFTSANPNYNITVVDGNLVITTPSSSSTTDAAAGGGGGGGCGVGGGMALLAVGLALARRRR